MNNFLESIASFGPYVMVVAWVIGIALLVLLYGFISAA